MTQGMINPASNSRKRVCQVREVSRGVTPVNPIWKTLPILEDTNLDSMRNYERSGQMKSNRMGGQQVGGTQTAGGQLSLALKNDTAIRDVLESAFSGLFAFPTLSGIALSLATNGTNAVGTLLFTLNPVDGDTINLNGVPFTFRSVLQGGYNEVLIAATVTLTMDALLAAVNAATDDKLKVARYSKVSTNTLRIEYYRSGTVGNAYTIAFVLAGQGQINAAAAATSGSGTLATGTGNPDRVVDSLNRLYATGFRPGHKITVAGATTVGNNAVYRIVAVDPLGGWAELDRDIATAEAFPVGGSITSNAYFLKAGTNRTTFTHEVAYLDLNPVVYDYFRGDEANDGTIEIPTSGEAKISVNMVGLTSESTNVPFPIGSGARNAVEDVVSFAGSVNGSSIIRDGIERYDAESMTVTFNNNREAKFGVGSEFARFVDEGDFDSEIQAGIYFTNLAQRQKFLQGVRQSIIVQLEDQRDKHRLVLEYPRAVVTAAPKGRSGNAVTEQVTWFAEEDPVAGTKMMAWFIPNGGQP